MDYGNIGGGGTGGTGGIAGVISGYYQKDNTLYGFSYHRIEEFVLFSESNPKPYEYISEYSFLYGKVERSRWGMVSASSGIGFVNGILRGKQKDYPQYEPNKISTIGIPIDLQAYFTPFPFFGMGINLFSNFNLQKSVFGIAIGIQVGYLWNKF
ncbi:MAG: hypothetical protein FJ218_08280 [Ignavibacteria bacterium]|nr:hypothetical protein [Ignavibacteria bacterium]